MSNRVSYILNPVGEVCRTVQGLARRPTDLAGITIGLLNNTKANAESFLDELGQLLVQRYRAAGTVRYKRPHGLAIEPFLNVVAGECQFVITGVGD